MEMGHHMKRKILAIGLFSLCSLAFLTGESQAWLLNCFHHRYVTQITCRPYNAFTPICWGNLVCDGCCPSFGGGCQMPTMMGAPYACGMGSCYGGACGGAAAPGAMPPVNNQFTPPMPMPTGPNTTMFMPPGVAQANYYPQAYYPNYYTPNYYMPMQYTPYMGGYPMPQQPMPYYWYGQ
jgi:hypothetical protein